MLMKTLFAGFGGQGVLMMGYSLAHAGMIEDKYITYMPSYGVEVRGGTANCTVAVSDEEIASPIASAPDYLVVMNNPSLIAFQNVVETGGFLFLNSSMIDARPLRGDIRCYEVPVSDAAEELGDIRTANMVMMGAFIKVTNLVAVDALKKALENLFVGKKKKLLTLNRKAVDVGYRLING